MDKTDPSYDFILSGVRDGFYITDSDKICQAVEVENYRSATNADNFHAVETQIQYEVDNHRYVVVSDKPLIVSALGSIPKSDSSVRLIHDCSRPPGYSVNDFAENDKFRYQSLHDAVDMIKPGFYMAKLDLASAYRSVRIHPSNYTATGLKWTFSGCSHPTYLVDTRLPFGARTSPGIFHQLGQAVRKMLSRQNINNVIVYLDDFLIIGETKEQCNQNLLSTIRLLRYLGFAINYNKVIGPSQNLTFLGIVLDSVSMSLSLPENKLDELLQCLHETLTKKKASKKSLQSLAGKLNWASQVIYGGRFHMRRIFDAVIPLKSPWHRTRVTMDIRRDINWWIQFLGVFNGTAEMLDSRPVTPVCIDACPVAAGGAYDSEFIYTPWDWWPGSSDLHINYKETLALEPAVALWAHTWRNKKVYVRCDNQAAVGIINKGSCRHPFVMESLRRVFWYSAVYNFRLKAIYLPGEKNQVADAVSRLHERYSIPDLVSSRF